MIRKFFGLIFMIYAIGVPIAFFNAGNHKLITSDPGAVLLVIVFEFIFIFSAIKLLKKKKVPQQEFYGGDYRFDSYRERENATGYSNYNSNTVNYTSNHSISYTEININSDKYDEEKTEAKTEAKTEETPRPVSVSCPGCGAKVKVYRKQFTDCEYCGTTVEAS